jgi:hypothetical protein
VNADQIHLLADELTGYHDATLDVRTLASLHERGMRRLTRLINELSENYFGPDRQAIFFALRSVAIDAEKAMRLRVNVDRLPEWTWRPILRARVDKIAHCLAEVARSAAVSRPATGRPGERRPISH